MAALFQKVELGTVATMLVLLTTPLTLADRTNMPDDTGKPNSPIRDHDNNSQACDWDECQVGRQFCWHRQDGDDGRQCVSCDLLQRGCDRRGDWGSLTDCLAFKCFESRLLELPKKEAEIAKLHKENRDLIIGCSVEAAVILIMGVILGIWKLRQQRNNQEDTQSLLTKTDSQTSMTSVATIPANAIDQGEHLPPPPANITGNTTTFNTSHEQVEPLPPPASNLGSTSDCLHPAVEEPRAMCSAFKQIPPTNDEDKSTQLVTNFTAMVGTP